VVETEMGLTARQETLLKWTAHAVVVAATVATAFDITPVNKVLFLIGCSLWTWVGVIWRQPSLWTLNLFCGAIYVAGLWI
jgi:hypothetical protein